MPSDVEPVLTLDGFCEREFPRLVRSVGVLVADVHLAEDLAQEALARACRDWNHVRTLESPGGWVHRVAMNLALSALRSRRTRRRIDAQIQSWARGTPTAHEAEDVIAARQALAMLPERARQVLVLRYMADLSVADVAAMLGCPEGTVKTLARRAIQQLRDAGWVVED